MKPSSFSPWREVFTSSLPYSYSHRYGKLHCQHFQNFIATFINTDFIPECSQAISGFVALRDVVRHTESQFHLRQFDWLLKLWRPHLDTSGQNLCTPHISRVTGWQQETVTFCLRHAAWGSCYSRSVIENRGFLTYIFCILLTFY